MLPGIDKADAREEHETLLRFKFFSSAAYKPFAK